RVLISAVSFLFLFLTPSLRAGGVEWPAKVGAWTLLPSDAREGTQINKLEIRQPFMKEAGLLNADRRIYQNDGNTAEVTLYTFRDSSGAYEAYTILQEIGRAHV